MQRSDLIKPGPTLVNLAAQHPKIETGRPIPTLPRAHVCQHTTEACSAPRALCLDSAVGFERRENFERSLSTYIFSSSPLLSIEPCIQPALYVLCSSTPSKITSNLSLSLSFSLSLNAPFFTRIQCSWKEDGQFLLYQYIPGKFFFFLKPKNNTW